MKHIDLYNVFTHRNRIVAAFVGREELTVVGRIHDVVFINNNNKQLIIGIKIKTDKHIVYLPLSEGNTILYLD